MKTIKKFCTLLNSLIKKFFFKGKYFIFKTGEVETCMVVNSADADVERIKFEEYISRYTCTTRWQTI